MSGPDVRARSAAKVIDANHRRPGGTLRGAGRPCPTVPRYPPACPVRGRTLDPDSSAEGVCQEVWILRQSWGDCPTSCEPRRAAPAADRSVQPVVAHRGTPPQSPVPRRLSRGTRSLDRRRVVLVPHRHLLAPSVRSRPTGGLTTAVDNLVCADTASHPLAASRHGRRAALSAPRSCRTVDSAAKRGDPMSAGRASFRAATRPPSVRTFPDLPDLPADRLPAAGNAPAVALPAQDPKGPCEIQRWIQCETHSSARGQVGLATKGSPP